MAGNKKPQARKEAKKKPEQSQGPFLLETQYIREAEALQNAKYVHNFLQWSALGNFMDNQARDVDWLNLQYWLYITESLVAIHHIDDDPDMRVEFGVIIGDAFNALHAAGRRYKESGQKVMRMSPMEIELIREAFWIGDAYKEGLDDKTMLGVARYVNKLLNRK